MGGDTNGTAAVTANSSHRAACGDSCGFAAARAARRIGQVPGIAGFSVEEIVGFIGHQEFGRVGVAKKDGAGGFEAGDERGVLLGHVVFAEKRTGWAGPTGDVDAAFDGDRDAVERAERISAQNGGLGDGGLQADFVLVQMDKGVELGLASGDSV